MDNIIPNNEAFFLQGGITGCLLLYGFTSMPEETSSLGDYLAGTQVQMLSETVTFIAAQKARKVEVVQNELDI